ncbi:MAG: hypothetical protein SGBAC_013420 [Bacillariaceae sp.]
MLYTAVTTAVERSVVAMMTTFANKHKKEPSAKRQIPEGEAKKDAKKLDGDTDPKSPPFLSHSKESAKNGGTDYKGGDSKVWNGIKLYFHVSPNHKDNKRWFKLKETQKKEQERGDSGAPSLAAALSDASFEGELSTR